MSFSFDLSIEVSEPYDFDDSALPLIRENTWVKNQWPLVYFIRNDQLQIAYVGESTNAAVRIKSHLSNPLKSTLNKISIIGSDKFNKSAALDIEANLIRYIAAEGTYELQNGNYGLINHRYYQQDLYKKLFREIWSKLTERKIVTKSLEEVENSEIFKYSPYKSLNEDQYNSVLEILDGLTTKKSNRIFVSGSAGTGKTILATYLVKLLTIDLTDIRMDELNDNEIKEIQYIVQFRKKYPQAKVGLVVAMTSLRVSLENVFRRTPGLKASMIVSPSDTFKGEKFDLLIVDEAHRLRKYKNISWRGEFKKKNRMLGLGDDGNELDWILANSKNQIFFYDSAQSVKPSDVDAAHFAKLLNQETTLQLELKSQMRVQGGSNYIEFVDALLHCKPQSSTRYQQEKYELLHFDSFADMYREMQQRESRHKLCRIVAGYAWEWKSDPKRKPADTNAIDIEIEGLCFQWNQTDKDWVNHPKDPNDPLKEIGCIHTVQGYDLNYTGVIFGNEIRYNSKSEKIEIDSTQYYDKYGRIGVDEEELKEYIINIYKTLMYRGIKGTFVYACDKNLREYLKAHIHSYQRPTPFRILKFQDVRPYVNSVPLVDISAAAGEFSDLQQHSELTWVELPFMVGVKPGYFVCRVIGESMNKRIPNGAYCLFKQDEGGSRKGETVLVELTSMQDPDSGSRYTVKKYSSTKSTSEDVWEHETITLSPDSTDSTYKDIVLKADEVKTFKVVGVFVSVLPEP